MVEVNRVAQTTGERVSYISKHMEVTKMEFNLQWLEESIFEGLDKIEDKIFGDTNDR